MFGYVKINRRITNVKQDPIMDGKLFEGVQNFRYFWHLDRFKKYKIEEIKSRISTGNSSFCKREQIFRSRAVSKVVQN